jgi:hypothetical protein
MEWFRDKLRVIVFVLVVAMAVPFLLTLVGMTQRR